MPSDELAHLRQRVTAVEADNAALRRQLGAQGGVAPEAYGRLLLENAPEYILLLDADGTIRFINHTSDGTPPEALIGRNVIDFNLPEYHPQVRQALRAAAEGSCSVDYESAARDLSGRVGHYFSRLVRLPGDGPVRLMVICHDITRRKEAEDRLRENEHRLRELLDSLPVVAWEFDAQTMQFTYVNGRAEHLLGYPLPTWYEPGFWPEHIHPEDRDWAVAFCKSRHHEPGTYELEYRMLAADGRVVWMQDIVTVDLAGGPQPRISGVLLDVTRRKEAELHLRESEHFLNAVLDGAPVGIQIFDAAGVSRRLNARQQRLLGLPSTDHGVGHFNILTDPFPQATGLSALFEQAVAGQVVEVRDLAVPLGHPANLWQTKREEIHVDRFLFPVQNDAGRVEAVVSFNIDASERHCAEQDRLLIERKLQETQKLESLGVLAGGVAHDFNNLLTSILGYASLAQMELPAGAPAQAHLDQVTAASRQAADLCKQMLAYAGKGRFVLESVDLGLLIHDVVPLLQISLGKQVVLRLDLAAQLPAVLADPTQMRQILMNLVLNASEALGEGPGTIRLLTAVRWVDRRDLDRAHLGPDLPEGSYVVLEVRDDGCGMDSQTHQRIFDPFFSTKFIGRGLGLAAVLGIVRGHQGAIQVESEAGRGSTFRVLLPAGPAPAKHIGDVPRRPAATVELRHGLGTVLLAEDEAPLRNLATRMLEMLGFAVAPVVDGQEAVECFRAQPDRFRLVLLDLTMPRLKGEVAFQALRSLRPDVPVILMSGYSEQEVAARFAGLGLAGFLQKPFSLSDLATVLRRATVANERESAGDMVTG